MINDFRRPQVETWGYNIGHAYGILILLNLFSPGMNSGVIISVMPTAFLISGYADFLVERIFDFVS